MTYEHISLDHIPDEHLRGVGLVAQAWAYLEGALERICWLMTGVQREALGQALTTHMTVRSRYDAAKALVHNEFSQSNAFKTLKTLQNKITAELAGRRNDIVHSRLHGFAGSGRVYRITYKARGEVRAETWPAEIAEYEAVATEIVEAADQLIDVLNELVELVRKRDGAVPPWTERP